MIKKLDDALLANDDIMFINSGNATFFLWWMGILSVDLNFDEDDPEIIIHVRLMAWYNRFKQSKACKTDVSRELMPVAWHPTKLMHVRRREKGNRTIFDRWKVV